ncbi:unnamed protein product [Microthlaspi erraticum]|uniref:Uncharacterized protein n=1 Tax=Microthlaspi erraticum TaxID=1685480 RepID=A0A6D2JN97_9BRAS|nr:unnamed protein product [Microthlaspi erraticum]
MYPIVNPSTIPGPNPIAAAIQLNTSSSSSSSSSASGVSSCCDAGMWISLQTSSREGPKVLSCLRKKSKAAFETECLPVLDLQDGYGKFMYSRNERFPNSCGISPESLFRETSSDSRADRFPIDDGMWPVKALFDKFST